MKIKNTLPQIGAVLFLIIALASCQEDFDTLGSDIIGGQEINSTLHNTSTVISFSRKLEAIQTSSLPLYQLGTYNDPVYGKSKVELVSQVTMGVQDPDFGFDTFLDSVVLYLPYYSESTIIDDITTYTLDSVYGSDPINLKIYESNYFLSDFDPEIGLQERQKYYSSFGSAFEIESNIGDLIYEVENFLPSNAGYTLTSPDGEDEDTDLEVTEVAPGLRIKLPVTFFKEKIIDMEDTSELMNNNNFKEYFRGLYFQVDDQGTDGNLFLFDLDNTSANITLHYNFLALEDDTERENGSFVLAFDDVNNNVNFYNNQLTPSIEAALNNPPNETEGEETLYVRGGEGIVSIIKLFGEDIDGNGVADELDEMRQNEWLINEANLIFYVDQDKVTGGEVEPERLIIYDAINAAVLVDYGRDETISEPAEDALTGHLGKLERGSDENGDFYKMRITHHIGNLVHQDSTNVPLALMVTNNVLTGGFKSLEAPIILSDDGDDENDFDLIPSAGAISHEGTVLFGNNTSNNEKRLKLQIYYTEPN